MGDKSGSVAKAIVAAPTFDPVRQVEFGCPHIHEYMNQSPEVAEKLTNSYAHLNSILGKPLETQITTKDPKDSKKLSLTTLKPTFLCLNCAAINTAEDRDSHCKLKKHVLAIESRSGCLWCGMCDDFVYDPYFERIRVDQGYLTANGKRKRKLSAIYPQGEEDKFILPNSNALSCQAGAPRGIYNLGQTCYLSVILQAMVHNPLMRNFFLSSRHDTAECEDTHCVACALTASFTDIFATEKLDGHGPVEMLHKSWLNSPNLAGYHQQDAHEYFQSLLDQLHRTSDCANRKDSKKCDCLYHQIFYGRIRSTVTCLSCGNITVTDDTIVDLALDLGKQATKRKKLNAKESPMKQSQEKPPLELTQCLKDFTTPEKLAEYSCKSPQCSTGSGTKVRKHMTIKNLPATLCIVLKRFEHSNNNSQKLDTKLSFPLQLDMSPYTTRAHNKKKKGVQSGQEPLDGNPNNSTPLSPRSPGWYDLSTVVVHKGKIDGGHYICYCKRDNQWFKFDDSKVTLATESQVMEAEPYLLFYIIRNLGGVNDKDSDKSKENGKRKEVNGTADVDGDAEA